MDGAEQLHRPPARLWNAVETRLLVERLGRREEGIEQDLLRDDAYRDLGVARMLVDVEAPDRGGAAALVNEAGEDVDQGRLAGAVRAEQAENLSARNVEADPVQRALAAGVGFLKVVDADRGEGLGHAAPHSEIGRASCRERVCQSV